MDPVEADLDARLEARELDHLQSIQSLTEPDHKELSRLMGVRAEPRFLPPRPGDVRHSQASIQLAAQELGFHPRVTFEEGLTRTVEHFRHGV